MILIGGGVVCMSIFKWLVDRTEAQMERLQVVDVRHAAGYFKQRISYLQPQYSAAGRG